MRKPDIEATDWKVKSVSGDHLSVIGTTKLTVTMGGKTEQVSFTVVKDHDICIFGCDGMALFKAQIDVERQLVTVGANILEPEKAVAGQQTVTVSGTVREQCNLKLSKDVYLPAASTIITRATMMEERLVGSHISRHRLFYSEIWNSLPEFHDGLQE